MPLIATETGHFHTDYRQELQLNQTVYRRVGLLVGLVLVYAVVPLFASEVTLSTLRFVGVAAIAAVGLNILVGSTGQISLGHAAFAAVGAYTAGNLAGTLGLPFYLVLPAAAVVAGMASAVFGIAALRIKGLYLAIATLAAQYLVDWILVHWSAVTGGFQGVMTFPRARLGPLDLGTPVGKYFLIMGVLGLAVAFTDNLMRTRTGRAFIAVRDQDLAAAGAGISLLRYKMLSFFIAAALAGVSGALYGYNVGLVTNEVFTLDLSIQYLAIILVGGLGSVPGSLMGAALVMILPVALREFLPVIGIHLAPSVEVYVLSMLYGVAILLFLILEPRGLYGLYAKIRDYFRMWPFSY